MPIFPLGWNTVKTLVTMIPGEVNISAVLTIVTEVELAGGHYDQIFAGLSKQADVVFPDVTFRPVAVFILNQLEKIASAPPTPKPEL